MARNLLVGVQRIFNKENHLVIIRKQGKSILVAFVNASFYPKRISQIHFGGIWIAFI
jgi:hypothetical protein